MKLLLDTHILLWAAGDPGKLSEEATELMTSTENTLLFSPASLWEIAIKSSLGRPDFSVSARVLRRGLLDSDYVELPISSRHAAKVEELPKLHKDPFDRLLLAQASAEGIQLVTADEQVARYPGPILQV
ncbi:MAG: type II toxin-antitoxin system VapC family toxin [Acidobacteriota bacterium]